LSNWFSELFHRLFSRGSTRPGQPALRGDVDPEMRDVFIGELAEIARNADKALAAWRDDFSNPTHTRTLTRAFHTLKGSAPVVGATQLAELGKFAEQTAKTAGRKRNPDLSQIEALEAAVALLPHWHSAIRDNLPAPEDTRGVIAQLRKSLA